MELESKEPTTLNLRTVRQFFHGGDAVLRGIAEPAGDLILAHALAKMATSPGGILKSEIPQARIHGPPRAFLNLSVNIHNAERVPWLRSPRGTRAGCRRARARDQIGDGGGRSHWSSSGFLSRNSKRSSTEQACWIPCSLHSPLYVETSILQVRIRKF